MQSVGVARMGVPDYWTNPLPCWSLGSSASESHRWRMTYVSVMALTLQSQESPGQGSDLVPREILLDNRELIALARLDHEPALSSIHDLAADTAVEEAMVKPIQSDLPKEGQGRFQAALAVRVRRLHESLPSWAPHRRGLRRHGRHQICSVDCKGPPGRTGDLRRTEARQLP